VAASWRGGDPVLGQLPHGEGGGLAGGGAVVPVPGPAPSAPQQAGGGVAVVVVLLLLPAPLLALGRDGELGQGGGAAGRVLARQHALHGLQRRVGEGGPGGGARGGGGVGGGGLGRVGGA